MASTEELKQLAAQLAHPRGDIGKDISRMMEQTNGNMTEQAIQSLSLQAGQRVLELGHGNAGHVSALLHAHPRLQYFGLDVSETMQQEAVRKNKDGVKNKSASFHIYDGRQIPFQEPTFDAIFLVNTIYFVQDPASLIHDLALILRPAGKLAITFAERTFMERLPFTAYGFNLYEEAELRHLADYELLEYCDSHHGKEQVTSKAGDRVERHFTTLVWTRK